MKDENRPMSDEEALELITREIRQTNNGKLLLANVPRDLRAAVSGLIARGKLNRAKFLEYGDAISESDENARRAALRDEGFGRYESATVRVAGGKEIAEAPARFVNLSDALARIAGTPTSGDKTRPWIRDCSERDPRRQFLVIRGVAQVRQLPSLSMQRLIDDEMTYARQGTFSPSYLEGHRDATLGAYFEADPAVAAAHASLLQAAWQKKLEILPAHRDTPALIAATLGLTAEDLLPVVEVSNDSEKPLCKARLANGDVWTIEPGPGWVLTVTSPTGRQSAVSLKDGVAELVVKPNSNGVAVAAADLERAFGEEHPEFDREAHSQEVSCGDTRLWEYWEWVVHQVEADGRAIEDEVARQANCRCG